VLCIGCYLWGAMKGYQAAKLEVDDNWWVKVELQVDEERQRIWREEG
jgi:hypothetical protein